MSDETQPDEIESSNVLANLRTQAKMALALGMLIALLLIGTVTSLLSQREAEDASDWVNHTYTVLNAIDNIQIALLEQETGLRGYIITGQPDFLESYRLGQQNYGMAYSDLHELTRDNREQQDLVQQLDDLSTEWHRAFVDPVLRWVDDPATRDQAIDMVNRGEGKRRTDHMKVLLESMEEAERGLLTQREIRSDEYSRRNFAITLTLIAAGIVFGALALFTSSRLITRPLHAMTDLMTRLAGGDREIQVTGIKRKDEIGALARALQIFKNITVDAYHQNWIKTQVALISDQLQAATTQAQFGEALMSRLTPQLSAALGMFYQAQEDGSLQLTASYGFRERRDLPRRYESGEGLVGQCARQAKPIVLDDVPADYLRIHSALGEAAPRWLILTPVMIQGRVTGVLEFGSFRPFSDQQQKLLETLMPVLALSAENLARALKTQLLLEETQAQAEELTASEESLRAQQEELRVTNEQLEQQGRQLRASEEELRVQAEELKVANEEMQLKTDTLNQQKGLLEKLQEETEQKAEDLAQASRYKSEFLANMSHELRTPLNSMLILSKSLADNDGGNLDNDQQEAAKIINDSGHNLLRLINDILDLSKVEAGKMEVFIETLDLRTFGTGIDRTFRHVSRERGLEFRIDIAPNLPQTIEQDGAKISQVVTNLLSNAFKFTAKGSVVLEIARPLDSERIPGVAPEETVAFRVTDSGIGIPPDKLARIFGAFEQVDGTTSRKYGGTGLGLSISKNMAELLGGRISVRSVEGENSTFVLSLPQKLERGTVAAARAPARQSASAGASAAPASPSATPVPVTMPEPPPDSGKPLILVVEDDPTFSKILGDAIRKRGCEVITAADGESGYAAAEKYKPTGIILDVALPGMDGWSVMERLKANVETRHIPVHFMSGVDDTLRGMGMGAVGYMVKPVSKEGINAAFDKVLHFAKGKPRKLLLVDDDRGSRAAVRTLIDMSDVTIIEAHDGTQGLNLLKEGSYDCLILDLMLPDMDGHEFLKRATQDGPIPPVVIYSAKTLSSEETAKLRQYTDSIVIKSARSPERLLDEVTLFLHSIRDAHTPAAKVERAANTDLSGKTALIVDDDMRNVFALSRVLRTRGLNVVMAEDGYKAIAQLEQNKLIDIVLMDIMMPGMDGYATMREIRKRPEWRQLPMIAVSAKAMTGDREKCIEAGANDYLSKPIDIDKLVSMMRVYL